MRSFAAALGLWVICTSAGLAQNPANTVATPSTQVAVPVATTSVEPAVTLPAGEETRGGFYSEVEFLLRWFKPVCETPAVLTIGDPAATSKPGALGQPGTVPLIGQSHKFEFPMTPGVQVTVGWDRGDGAIRLEVSGFMMEPSVNSQHFTANKDGSPNTYLAYQAPDNTYQALPFTVPGVVTGGSISVGSTRIWGVESDFFIPFKIQTQGPPGELSYYGKFLFGGRYLDLTDRVRVSNTLSLVADPSAAAYGADQFSTHNQFAGPQVGGTLGATWRRLSLEGTLKLAAGITHQLRNIEGSPLSNYTVLSPDLVPGPFLALPSNIGRETARRVTLVPEIGVKSQLAITSWCSLSFGYSLLYWNKVLCPGDQMSPLVNITQLPFHGPVVGPLDPPKLFVKTDYFAQGLDFGLQFHY